MGVTSDILLLIIAGCLGGFVSGLLGVGGGIIFVPILDYFLNKNGVHTRDLVPYTLANSFLAILVSGITGSYSALRAKTINYPHLVSVSITAVIAVLFTSYLISRGNWYSPQIFKLVFGAMLIFTLFKTLLHIETDGLNEQMSVTMALSIGILTGVISGLSGLGGGIVMIPLFMIFGKMTIRKASVLSLAIIPMLAIPNVLYYAFSEPSFSIKGSTGYLAWPLALPLLIGVLMTVKAGLKVAGMLSPKAIKVIFAGFIILTFIKTISSIANT